MHATPSDARARRHSRGVAMVEAALVLPLLLALTFSVIEFGFYFRSWFAARNAAREGAREAAAFRAECNVSAVSTQVDAIVSQLLDAADLSDAPGLDVDLPRPVCGADPQGLVEVRVAFDHEMPVLSAFFSGIADPFPATLPVEARDLRRDFNF